MTKKRKKIDKKSNLTENLLARKTLAMFPDTYFYVNFGKLQKE